MNLRRIKNNLLQADVADCVKKICSLLKLRSDQKVLLDLGTNDGSKTLEFAGTIDVQNTLIIGADINNKLLLKAKGRGMLTLRCDFETNLPFKQETVDVLVTNQVIEHLSNTDLFIENISRILKRNGYAIIATENISYWANIVVMILGYQAFSQNISDYFHIGNPFSGLAGEEFPEDMAGHTHRRIFSIRGLPSLLEKYNFKIEAVLGAGFAPFPPWFSIFDKIHARFIVIKARKI